MHYTFYLPDSKQMSNNETILEYSSKWLLTLCWPDENFIMQSIRFTWRCNYLDLPRRGHYTSTLCTPLQEAGSEFTGCGSSHPGGCTQAVRSSTLRSPRSSQAGSTPVGWRPTMSDCTSRLPLFHLQKEDADPSTTLVFSRNKADRALQHSALPWHTASNTCSLQGRASPVLNSSVKRQWHPPTTRAPTRCPAMFFPSHWIIFKYIT